MRKTIGVACAFALPLTLGAAEPIVYWSFDGGRFRVAGGLLWMGSGGGGPSFTVSKLSVTRSASTSQVA